VQGFRVDVVDKLPTKYRIADISISEDGKEIWIGYFGSHADQGGFTFRWGECGLGSIDDAMSVLKNELHKNISTIHDILKTKRGEK